LPETDQFNTLGIPETIQTTERIVNEWLVKQNVIPQTSYIFCIDINETKQFIGLIALTGLKTLAQAMHFSARL